MSFAVYASSSVVSRLYYAERANDYFTFAFAAFREWGVDLKGLRTTPFVATHRRFLFYEESADIWYRVA